MRHKYSTGFKCFSLYVLSDFSVGKKIWIWISTKTIRLWAWPPLRIGSAGVRVEPRSSHLHFLIRCHSKIKHPRPQKAMTTILFAGSTRTSGDGHVHETRTRNNRQRDFWSPITTIGSAVVKARKKYKSREFVFIYTSRVPLISGRSNHCTYGSYTRSGYRNVAYRAADSKTQNSLPNWVALRSLNTDPGAGTEL